MFGGWMQRRIKAQRQKFERSCIVCRDFVEKTSMKRIAKLKSGAIILDQRQNMGGRGSYVCNLEKCLSKCVKSKCLNRAFKCNVNDEVYQLLLHDA
ncbi:MAG: YlxR family protein [Clostridiales bacterium]|jgi:predicted RNA-binding protein YlxR (DUF448 family)|nr:YlxR family protein [Clostridiales bacterium]